MSAAPIARCPERICWTLSILTVLYYFASPLAAHRMEGELTLVVRDATGLPMQARVELLSWVSLFRTEANCDPNGQARFRRLPLGVYRLRVTHPEFQPFSEPLEIPSELPITRHVTLNVAEIETAVRVRDSAPLLDPNQSGTVFQVGRSQLDENAFSTLGRSTINVVNRLPGWLLEANAVLHPRGSEYGTQYVIDGVPVYDNRSIGFAPGYESDEFEAVNVMTANIPAEFGRRMGGVIELYTRRSDRPGHHPEITIQGGSFSSTEGAFSDHYLRGRTSLSLGLRGGHTDRYLDPPSLENFTNKASSAGYNARLYYDLSDQDRLSLYLRYNRVNFLVPNDLQQQANGQRQDRRGGETAGQIHYQHVFSPRTLGAVRGMVRDVSADLRSNALSIPVFTQQDRGFREGAITGSVTVQFEHHTLKFGGDWRRAELREHFLFAQSDDLPEIEFDFRDKRTSTDLGLFIQDHLRLGNLVVDAGVRVDHYRLFVRDSAVSPRVGASYYWEGGDLMFRGSYNRAYQTPAIENLLLSSSVQAQNLEDVEGALPVPPSRADFYEVGVRKAFGDRFRLDVNHYWRDFENYYDDDVFLNTGLGFPISFESAEIEGTELRLEMPRFKGFSSFISYSNMLGTATSPVTGGLFVEGGEAEELRDVARTFPISQDQRNTVSAVVRFQPHHRVWFVVGAHYGSGLPVELEDEDDGADTGATSLAQAAAEGGDEESELKDIPEEILRKVNFERGRVRPNFSLDLSLGVKLWEKDQKSLRLQFDVVNSTNRLNVINFSGLFSGTALAPPRLIGVKLRATL